MPGQGVYMDQIYGCLVMISLLRATYIFHQYLATLSASPMFNYGCSFFSQWITRHSLDSNFQGEADGADGDEYGRKERKGRGPFSLKIFPMVKEFQLTWKEQNGAIHFPSPTNPSNLNHAPCFMGSDFHTPSC